MFVLNDDIQLNVSLLRRRVPNLTKAARSVGLRPATVSNLCTGKTPVGRAEVRTLVALASLAGCSLDELIIRGHGIGMIETGIKVLDLFAPLVRGGTVGFVARPRMGQLVLLAELFHRMKKREFTTIFLMPEEKTIGIEEVENEADVTCHSLDEAYQTIASYQDERDILLAADRMTVLSGDILTLREKVKESGSRPVTLALVDSRGDAVDEETPYGPLDTLWRFDIDLVTRALYPAVDPVFSTSTILEGAQLEATHLSIQQRARKLLRRYKELRSLVMAGGIEKLPDLDRITYHRGQRLEAFLSQPFYVAEDFTKKRGEWLTVQETLEDIRRILDGIADDKNIEELSFIGRL